MLGYPERRTLEAVAETFFPGAVHSGVPDAFLEAFVSALSGSERRRLRALLAALAVSGFTRVRPDQRERVLRAWCDSRLALRRAGFQALRKGLLTIAYTLPGTPAWERIDYPGPLGRRADQAEARAAQLVGDDARLRRLRGRIGHAAARHWPRPCSPGPVSMSSCSRPEATTRTRTSTAPSSACAASITARARPRPTTRASASWPAPAPRRRHRRQLHDVLRTPDEIRAEWGEACSRRTRSAERSAYVRPPRREHRPQPALEARRGRRVTTFGASGWLARMPRNVRGCDQDGVCGYCGYGCPLGAKQSTARTWLVDAQAAGARIVVRTRAERVLLEGGRARGVEARTAEGHGITVRAVPSSSHAARSNLKLLRRSGLTAPGLEAEPAPPSRRRRVRRLRRGDQAVGGDAPGDLFRRGRGRKKLETTAIPQPCSPEPRRGGAPSSTPS